MKKSVLLAIIFILVLFLARTSHTLGVEPTTTPVPSTAAAPQNPGPPIGLVCGDTICLPDEECIQYPGDNEQHCVRMTPTPTPSITISPSPSPTPTIAPILDIPPVPEKCAEGTGVYPPNSSCYNDIMETQKDPRIYEKTCIYQPVVRYSDTRQYRSGNQSFQKCGKGVGPNGEIGPGGDDPECDVALLVNTVVKEAELGGYGPSYPAADYYSSDYLAQNYLFNSIFDRPLDLSDTNREAYRTYWRVMPASNQANLRSFIMNMANQGKIDNIKFEYTDSNGLKKQTDFKSLHNGLSKQIIFFWHFPFFRIGCLTQYPVCPEYAQAQRELKPDFEIIRESIRDIDFGAFDGIVDTALTTYEAAIAAFGGDLDGPYSAFVPLDFNSVRSYILKRKDEKEDNAYKFFDNFSPLPFYHLTNVSFEHLPYVGAIYQGLLSPKFGMLPSLTPDWVVNKYSTESGISDYKIGNLPQDLPEIKIAKRNFLETITEEFQALASNPFGWISDKIRNFFTDEDKKKGYIDQNADLYTNNDRIAEIREVYTNPVGCEIPLSYHQLSPKTVPKSIDDHHQVVLIPGHQLAWSYTPQCTDLAGECRINPDTGIRECGTAFACTGRDSYIENGQCCSPQWSVDATQDAKAFDVLNNPKQTDIRETVSGNEQYAFYSMMLPDGKQTIPEARIDAQLATHIAVATEPNGKGEVLNPVEPVNRIENQAQDSMHYLQNCWAVPVGLQNSPRCLLSFAATEPTSACTGEVFKTIVGDNPVKPSQKAEDIFKSAIAPKLTETVISAYTEAEEKTGVPCEVLAGIHFEEGGNNPDQDLQSGAPLAGRTLAESAIQAAEELKQKAGGEIKDLDTLVRAMSWYNGGGNSNCQASNSYNCPAASGIDRCGYTVACGTNPSACTCAPPQAGACRPSCTQGFPYQFSYNYCPPAGIGYDDPYVTNWWQSPQHDNMYLLYMYDCTQTRPQIHMRPGSLTVALSLYLTQQQSQTTTPTPQP